MTLASDSTDFPDVRISVSNFGPIASGNIDLRPLTMLVGPSNTGKTYFATLIYALHRNFSGFPRHPLSQDAFLHGITSSSKEDFNQILRKLKSPDRPFTISDLPTSVCENMEKNLSDSDYHDNSLISELNRCFDVSTIYDLIRWDHDGNLSTIVLDIGERNRRHWKLSLNISKPDNDSSDEDYGLQDGIVDDEPIEGISIHNSVEDFPLVPTRRWDRDEIVKHCLRSIRDVEKPADKLRWIVWELLKITGSVLDERIHYLPAARSGIMQAHRLIVSSLVSRSTRAGLERLPELPVLSGVVADFVEKLVLYDEFGSRRPRHRRPLKSGAIYHKSGRKVEESLSLLGEELEEEGLQGSIRVHHSRVGGLPDFVFSPLGSRREIRLSRASSMVAELAPLVLFLRGTVERGDTLILEEPEAHLHPAGQALIARTIARAVRAGVRVVVTTHSDWFLKEIGNLILEGELESLQGSSLQSSYDSQASLQAHQVGVWLFSQDSDSMGSNIREIKFDRYDGVEPPEYERVAEELYNRSVSLQNYIDGPLRRTRQ